MPSPFLNPAASTAADGLAIVHLRRDNLMPVILEAQEADKEEKVTTTRFGSFPHSTLIDQPWGSQIVASQVHGGRAKKSSTKRKADEALGDGGDTSFKSAASGFIHVLPPTPESWTAGLPHRTQVVYTPDYSYILHRLRARPGTTLIEAGSGSGSFTHAAARAVFNGYPSSSSSSSNKKQRRRMGKVCSYEFHEQRAGKVRDEIKDHGLEEVVFPTHRDVYADGFLLGDDPKTRQSPKATAIFLDLPAPWLAIKHLVRSPADGSVSPLDPSSPAYICTFSPCMEQVQKTISMLRQHGWLNISMVEVNHRRIEVRREYYGLGNEGVRRAIVFPKSVDEAVGKLRLEEARQKEYRKMQKGNSNTQQKDGTGAGAEAEAAGNDDALKSEVESDQVPLYAQGRLVHRTEPDLKTHTSYLVFAILPRVWSDEDERKCRETWPSHDSKS
ncbi:uncharacterized protein TRUGW13939_08316 [Talaromyces rugulosus]|uniref:tRNA (adenine(58)-N(1))-methyltransferase catalytic subunit TRM61 n=1 Tax=Talaromyces rugulosus TaxID=121627 RepID=A0A7H8R463_TALRU|nr:uncharacterized protein TRUGW13939_08316 [Talaromyces rugulosus]QKX61169.1 hypothetical protein TRUGW13939_08316 [Talaromyces rugulosus]